MIVKFTIDDVKLKKKVQQRMTHAGCNCRWTWQERHTRKSFSQLCLSLLRCCYCLRGVRQSYIHDDDGCIRKYVSFSNSQSQFFPIMSCENSIDGTTQEYFMILLRLLQVVLHSLICVKDWFILKFSLDWLTANSSYVYNVFQLQKRNNISLWYCYSLY